MCSFSTAAAARLSFNSQHIANVHDISLACKNNYMQEKCTHVVAAVARFCRIVIAGKFLFYFFCCELKFACRSRFEVHYFWGLFIDF